MMFTKHPTQDQPIARKSLAWLLAIQVFILVPHFVTAPIWIAVVWVMVAVWRWRIFQGAWNYPSKTKKTLLVAVCCGGLFLSLGASFRFESMVSLLLIGFILKLLELKNRKDFVLLIFIALFILAAQFIEFNHFLAAFYGLGCLTLLCATLMQLYKDSVGQSVWQDIRASFYILLQAIPFMIILFVVVPRIGSFWAVPSPQQSKTGMSDSMSPGDFTELMESNELAFRVSFVGETPAREKLYWRSLVFSFFDGRRWSQSREQKAGNHFNQANNKLQSHLEHKGKPIEYTLIAEASGQPWLYSLAAPKRWPENLGFARDMRLFSFEPVNERMSYRITASLDYQLNEISPEELEQNKLIPKNGNIKTRERAAEWLAETGSPEKLIEKIFAYYNQSFFYTLKPPALGVDVVDDFLWNSRQGFCEHFSSSFVFFMRAAGVPARVVVGYQGGDISSVDGSLTVRQRDAHAWAEVWLDGRGWVMFDPTAAVAPQRIQKGIEQSLSATDRQLLAKPFGSSIKVLLLMREQWDAVNLTWVQWVMNYDSSQQASLLERVLGEVSPMRIAVLVAATGSGFGILLFAVLILRNRQRYLPETSLIYLLLCKKLKVCGFSPLASETPRHFSERVILSRPELSPALGELMDLYEQLSYGDNPEVATRLRKAVKNFRPKA
jgi:transglutaminase-like putative cysteine protease